MRRSGPLISKYLLMSVLPYFTSAWLLLSVILFVQQGSRYSDIFFNIDIPQELLWQLAVALIPNVVSFTCPVAMLLGTVIGLTKMQSDSELVAIRASGVGNFQIALPLIVMGVLLSGFAFLVNSKGVPLAAGLVRNVALQSAIKKLESPIEPGIFNTEVAGYTIFVRAGNLETGHWENIFIFSEEKSSGKVRLITSNEGRIDTTGENTELVLSNATVTTLPAGEAEGNLVTENVGEARFAVRTGRADLIQRLSRSEVTSEEMGLQDLSNYASGAEGRERVEAQLLWQRRMLLSVTPFIFGILGIGIVLRFSRGGRGFGIFAALVVLIGFYVLEFLGEQLVRTGKVGVIIAALIPVLGSIAVFLWFMLSRRIGLSSWTTQIMGSLAHVVRTAPRKIPIKNFFVDLTTGLRDFDIVRNFLKNFLLSLSFVIALFLIFTAFELWKFAGSFTGGAWFLGQYLFFLLPFVYLQVAPSAAMVAILATYVIKSRQNEIVVWTSAGQSVYRLLVPCFLLCFLIGGVNWVVQENVLPGFNRRQDDTRALIRNKGISPGTGGRTWAAGEGKIYSFFPPGSGSPGDPPAKQPSFAASALPTRRPGFALFAPVLTNVVFASDNEKRHGTCEDSVHSVSVYEFASEGRILQAVYRADCAEWRAREVILSGNITKHDLKKGTISKVDGTIDIDEGANPFIESRVKPSHLSSRELREQINSADAETDVRNLSIALQKKYTILVLPLVMALFTAPFSLSLDRKGKAATIGSAVGLWFLFTGTATIFEQLGLNGLMPPMLAVWLPLGLFSLLGLVLLSKVKT